MTRIARAGWSTIVLVTLITAGVLARVGWAAWIAHAHPVAVTSPDTPGYLEPARALIDSWRFSMSPESVTPMFERTPGYPAFLGAILWVTNSRWAISPIQAAFSLLTVGLTVHVGRRIIGLTPGLVAGAVLVLGPLQFAASGTILTESLTSFVLIATVAIGIVVFARRPKDVPPLVTLALGASIAIATMVRPTMWFFPVVVLVLLAIRFRSVPRRTLLTHLLLFVLPIVVVVGGWQARNHSAVNSGQLSGASGHLMYCYDAAAVQAVVAGSTISAARRQLGCPIRHVNPQGPCTPAVGCRVPDATANGQGFDEWTHKALDILSEHPVQTVRVFAEGAVREIAGPGTDEVRRFLHIDASVPLTAALFLWNLVLWVLAAVGAVVGLRSKRRAFWVFVIATIGYVLVVSAGAQAYARFRTPLIPLLALLAALGLRSIVLKVRGSRTSRLASV